MAYYILFCFILFIRKSVRSVRSPKAVKFDIKSEDMLMKTQLSIESSE